jgi:tetratricopeptide (TPR) repeat protein
MQIWGGYEMIQIKMKKKLIVAIIILVIITLPTSAYAYNYNQYKSNYNEAITQLNSEKYDEAIGTFSSISNTYFGKKNAKEIKGNIENAKKLKENKKKYDDALKLFNEKKYLEAIEGFKKISKEDIKRSELIKKKIDECKNIYISLNIENAKNEAKANNYDSATNFLTLVLNLDSTNKDALALKDEYTKAKLDAEVKAKQEAEAKAKKDAEEKAKQVTTSSLEQSQKPSGYPKIACRDNAGIYIYQDEEQEKNPMSGAIWISFRGGITFGSSPNGFWYTLLKVGPGSEVEYTITFKYNGTEKIVKGVTSGTDFNIFSPDKYERGIIGTAEVTIIYMGKPYIFTQSFTN